MQYKSQDWDTRKSLTLQSPHIHSLFPGAPPRVPILVTRELLWFASKDQRGYLLLAVFFFSPVLGSHWLSWIELPHLKWTVYLHFMCIWTVPYKYIHKNLDSVAKADTIEIWLYIHTDEEITLELRKVRNASFVIYSIALFIRMKTSVLEEGWRKGS